MIPTLRSLPRPDALRDHLAAVYGIPFTSCTLLRSLVNDVYELAAPDGRYVLKLYRAGGWQPAEIRWETGLSAHLAAAGLAVPRVVRTPGGDDVGILDMPEAERAFVLSEFVEGIKPEPPFTDDLYRDFGRLVASFHGAGATYSPHGPRPAFDLQRRLEEPLAAVLPYLTDAEGNLLQALADAVRNNLTQYSGALRWGVCHGDVTLDNVLITGDGLVLYDFDLAAEGYQAGDLTGVAATPQWPAFLRGYSEHGSLGDADLAVIPSLTVANRIFNLRFHLVDKPRFRGTESRAEGWAGAELSALQQAASALL